MSQSVFMPVNASGYELCYPVRDHDFDSLVELIDGTPRRRGWTPIHMRFVDRIEGKALSVSDAPWLGEHALIFRRSVIDRLGDWLSAHGELLPLSVRDADLWVFNPKHVRDALDEATSSITRFSSGRIMDIDRHVFKADAIADAPLFKLAGLRASPVYFGDTAVEQWKQSGLAGLEFREVWSA